MVVYTVHWVAPQGWGTADLGPVWVRQRKNPYYYLLHIGYNQLNPYHFMGSQQVFFK